MTKLAAITNSYIQKMKPDMPPIQLTAKQHAVGTNALQDNELIVTVGCYYHAATNS